MSKLPVLSWREVIKVLSKKGFRVVRQKGSHMILQGPSKKFTVVPRHETIAPTTLMKILSQVGVTKEEFLNLLN
ncbi:MAG: type II toxin-antitoxin system HicA family toxin [Thermoproteota archaeon]